MSDNFKNEYNDDFFDAVLKLQNIDECYRFFGDVCTPKEIATMVQRYSVAKMLRENKVYNEIVEKTGASTATVSRVKRSLSTDSYGGYDIVFGRKKK